MQIPLPSSRHFHQCPLSGPQSPHAPTRAPPSDYTTVHIRTFTLQPLSCQKRGRGLENAFVSLPLLLFLSGIIIIIHSAFFCVCAGRQFMWLFPISQRKRRKTKVEEEGREEKKKETSSSPIPPFFLFYSTVQYVSPLPPTNSTNASVASSPAPLERGS